MKKLINIGLILLFCTGVFYTCKMCTRDTAHVVLRGTFVNEKQIPIQMDFYRGEKETSQHYWFTDTTYYTTILFFDIGEHYSIKMNRGGVIKWILIDATECAKHELTIDFKDSNTITL